MIHDDDSSSDSDGSIGDGSSSDSDGSVVSTHRHLDSVISVDTDSSVHSFSSSTDSSTDWHSDESFDEFED